MAAQPYGHKEGDLLTYPQSYHPDGAPGGWSEGVPTYHLLQDGPETKMAKRAHLFNGLIVTA